MMCLAPWANDLRPIRHFKPVTALGRLFMRAQTEVRQRRRHRIGHMAGPSTTVKDSFNTAMI